MINRHQAQPVRTGVIASFPNVDTMMKGFSKVVSLLPFDSQEFLERHGANAEAPNVVNIALRIFNEEDDMPEGDWNRQVVDSVNKQNSVLKRRGVRRVSIFLCRPGQYPVYFTLRDFNGVWGEEQAIRNIEPALAFQLELSRLSNYNLKPCFGESKQIHIYHAIARENQLDNRFFIRAFASPGRLCGFMSTAEHLISETDRLVTGFLDAFKMVTAEHRNADYNHIFMSSVYNLAVEFLQPYLAARQEALAPSSSRYWF